MIDMTKHRIITDGTSQQDRFPVALKEGYINADELQFEDLLALGADFAGSLKFYNLDNREDGDWTVFFSSDAAVVIADILSMELTKIESKFLDIFRNPFEPAESDLQRIPNYRLALKIDRWIKSLKTIDSPAGKALHHTINGVVEKKLGFELQALGQFFQRTITDDFDKVWLPATPAETPSPTEYPNRDDRRGVERFLKANFYNFFNSILLFQQKAQGLLAAALQSQAHSTATGLYISFLKLFHKVQKKANLFTARHLDFYYRNVLNTHALKGIPDRAFLVLKPNLEGKKIRVPAGTAFTAGINEDNRDIIYTADSDLLVHSSRVEALNTLFLERDELSSPENYFSYVTAAKLNQIPLLNDPSPKSEKELASWPIFGAPRSASQQYLFEDARLGFALASPVLLAGEGQRAISIAFSFKNQASDGEDSDADYFQTQIEKILTKSPPEGYKEDKHTRKAFMSDLFFKAFGNMFSISLTTAKGWHEVESYLVHSSFVSSDCPKNHLQFQIILSPDDSSVVPYKADIHGDGYDTHHPVIRFLANPQAYLYPYSLFDNLTIREIQIAIDVQDAKKILAYNNLGQLDSGGPFNPFGPLPAVGSYFILGHHECARKHVTRFEVDVEWGELPTAREGFKEYYEGYELPFENDVFEVSLTVLNGGRWQPVEGVEQPRIKLFEDNDEAEGINKQSRLSCQKVIRYAKPLDDPAENHEFSYSPQAKDGFFKFTLIGPEYAFGHRDFPYKLTAVLTANSRLKKVRLLKPIPNPPYTPLINAISINYHATTTVNLDKISTAEEEMLNEKLFHIHPLGIERLSPLSPAGITMLPRYEADGNLFIGIASPQLSDPLTLLFHMREDSTRDRNARVSKYRWHCLSSNRWVRLKDRYVISDTTRGFLSSGIVTLNIPEDINCANTTMPGGMLWLKVTSDEHPETPCSIYSVHTNALSVTWQPDENSLSHLEDNLPAGTIKEAIIDIPGIGKIDQIFDSTGGSAPESSRDYKTRISERLKHKNRATTPWDYERLILNRFPQIFKVKCFSNMVDDPEGCDKPGQVLIVVIADRADQPSANMQPMVNSLLLKEIEEYVKSMASPFAGINVRNPSYEKIQVRCRVHLSKGDVGGFYLNQLNQAINDYLSPWNKAGYGIHFGWCVRGYDIKSCIRNLEYVNFVTDFSMLRIAEDDNGYFSLFDTVASNVKEIRPVYPWSIAIPVRRHYLELIELPAVKDPAITGINELEIGSNFIIPGK